jgi:hypothetical protein
LKPENCSLILFKYQIQVNSHYKFTECAGQIDIKEFVAAINIASKQNSILQQLTIQSKPWSKVNQRGPTTGAGQNTAYENWEVEKIQETSGSAKVAN